MHSWDAVVNQKRGSTIFAAALGASLYAVFGVLDFYVFPDVASSILPGRLLVIAACLAIGALIAFAPAVYVRHSQVLLSAVILLAGLGIVWMNHLISSLPNGNVYYAGLTMVVACTFVFLPIRFRYAVPLCMALVVAYNFSLLTYAVPLPLAVVITNNFFLVGTAVICGRSCLDTERLLMEQYRQQALIEQQKHDIEEQKRRADNLLHNILPDPIAERLMGGASHIADGYSDVTVLFADLAGFTEFSTSVSPRTLVKVLNRVFSAFDDVAEGCGVQKIKTIGDAYMAACGLPDEVDDHPERMLRMAIGMREQMVAVREEFPNLNIDVRIGIHTGPCVAGVIGRQRFIYDLWGDTVNLASRMESGGITGQIQVTEATYLRTRHGFDFEPRGEIHVKGRG
jgi:class 3 adenylate cyclase